MQKKIKTLIPNDKGSYIIAEMRERIAKSSKVARLSVLHCC